MGVINSVKSSFVDDNDTNKTKQVGLSVLCDCSIRCSGDDIYWTDKKFVLYQGSFQASPSLVIVMVLYC